MFNSFSTALSALSANSQAIGIVGNNLANLNTTGYKDADVQFYDLMSQTLGTAGSGQQAGMGVGPAQSVRQFTQGSIQQSSGSLDAAINGTGFFVVQDTTGQTLYTRAGNFKLTADGMLETATGEKVQGWSAVGGVLTTSGPVGNVTIPVNGVSPAKVTTLMTMQANLNSQATVGSTGATFSAPVEVVDAQGASHVLTFTFAKTDVGKWSYAVTIPAADLTATGSTSVATGSLTFDGTGQLTSPAAGSPVKLTIKGLLDGAPDMNVNWDLYDASKKGQLTQLAQTSGVSSNTQDGNAAGQIVKVAMQDGGIIMASYSNGQQAAVGQVALASITNPDSMVAVGNNNLQATNDTAEPAIGTAASGGRGKVVGGSLEGSTVDIAKEFTNLITFQRSYQASSRVINTSDQMVQDLMSLIR